MTTEAFTPTPVYTISGTGPYTIEHAHQGDDELEIRLREADGSESVVDVADFSLSPAIAPEGPSGDLFLDATFAATNDGKKLIIERFTRSEQGWEGLLGEREAGLERQLDRTTQAVQDIAQRQERGLRLPFGTTASPVVPAPVANRALKWNEGGTALINSTYDPDAALAAALAAAADAEAAAAAAAASASAAAAAAAAASAAAAAAVIFDTRADLIAADLSGFDDGTLLFGGPRIYRKNTGATVLADKADLEPYGHPHHEHFAFASDATDESTKLQAYFDWVSTSGYRQIIMPMNVGIATTVEQPEDTVLDGYATIDISAGAVSAVAANVVILNDTTTFKINRACHFQNFVAKSLTNTANTRALTLGGTTGDANIGKGISGVNIAVIGNDGTLGSGIYADEKITGLDLRNVYGKGVGKLVHAVPSAGNWFNSNRIQIRLSSDCEHVWYLDTTNGEVSGNYLDDAVQGDTTLKRIVEVVGVDALKNRYNSHCWDVDTCTPKGGEPHVLIYNLGDYGADGNVLRTNIESKYVSNMGYGGESNAIVGDDQAVRKMSVFPGGRFSEARLYFNDSLANADLNPNMTITSNFTAGSIRGAFDRVLSDSTCRFDLTGYGYIAVDCGAAVSVLKGIAARFGANAPAACEFLYSNLASPDPTDMNDWTYMGGAGTAADHDIWQNTTIAEFGDDGQQVFDFQHLMVRFACTAGTEVTVLDLCALLPDTTFGAFLSTRGGDVFGDIKTYSGAGVDLGSPDGNSWKKLSLNNLKKLQFDNADIVTDPRRDVALSGTSFDPTTATWNEKNRFRPTGFPTPDTAIWHDDFITDRVYASYNGSGLNHTATYSAGALKIARNTTAVNALKFAPSGYPVFPTGFVSAEVTGWQLTGAGDAFVGIGLDNNNYIAVHRGLQGGFCEIIKVISGSSTQIATVTLASGAPTAPFKMALQFQNGIIEMLLDEGHGWYLVLHGTNGGLTNAQLVGSTPMVRASMADFAGDYIEFGSLLLGSPGMFGFRDPALLKYEDGTPYQQGRKMFLLCSGAAPEHGGITHVGEYDTAQKTFKPTGYFSFYDATNGHEFRVGSCGIFDRNAGYWRIFVSGWGSAGGVSTGVTMFTSDFPPTEGPIFLDGGADLSLPAGSGDYAYDPDVVWDEGNQQWWVAYTIWDNATGNFWPALATSNDLVTFSLVGEDTSQTKCEGTKITKMGGVYKIFASVLATVRVYDDTMTLDGTISGLVTSGSISPPWFLPIPIRDRGKTVWQAIQFNDVTAPAGEDFTWGDGVVWQAAEERTGFEFQPVHSPE